MSEFSDSCHLRAKLRDDAVRLLVAAKVPGLVFDAAAGWVPFVFPDVDRHLDRVVAANTGLLVHYEFAEDHGCEVTIYDRAVRVAGLHVGFESTKPGRFDREAFVARGLLTAADADEIARWVGDVRRDRESRIVAAYLGLRRHEWFAYRYVAHPDREKDRREFIEVRADGRVGRDHEAEPTAPSIAGGPLFELAIALVDELVATNGVELTSEADRRELAEDLAGTLSELAGADPVAAVRELLMSHERVDELFADDASLANALQHVRGRSAG